MKYAIGIYLAGYIAAYLALKINVSRGAKRWLVKDKLTVLRWSILSWWTVVIAILITIDNHIDKNGDQPAKW